MLTRAALILVKEWNWMVEISNESAGAIAFVIANWMRAKVLAIVFVTHLLRLAFRHLFLLFDVKELVVTCAALLLVEKRHWMLGIYMQSAGNVTLVLAVT